MEMEEEEEEGRRDFTTGVSAADTTPEPSTIAFWAPT